MKAKDVMTHHVVFIEPDATITQAARLMLGRRISGLPVVNRTGNLVGIVTEGDFLRRVETNTQRRRPRWLEFLVGSSRLAGEYTHTHGRKVEEVMTPDPVTVAEDTSLEELVRMMEKCRIKRLPVVRGQELVGIVSRANLVRALATVARDANPAALSDEIVRERVMAEIGKQSWAPAPAIEIHVRNGRVELWGTFADDRVRSALIVAAENVPGVKTVRDNLVWVDPMSAMAFLESDAEGSQVKPS